MKRFFLIFILLFIHVVFLKAQKIWTLQNCIDYALANNIQIKQQRLSEQLASINLIQSKAQMFPDLNGFASHAYNYGKTIDMYTNEFASSSVQSNNFYLGGNITLFNGFQLLNTVKQKKIDLQASQFDVEKMMNDISLNIATAYLQILFNTELLNIAEKQLSLTKGQVDRTQKLLDAGTVSKGTLLTLEAQVSTEELNVVKAQNNLSLSYLTLTQMLDITSPDSFYILSPALDNPAESSLLTPPEQIYASALSVQPEIKSAELKVKSSELEKTIAKGMLSPSLSMRCTYGTGFSGASMQLEDATFNGRFDTIGYTFEVTPVPVVMPSFDYRYVLIPFNKQIKDNINKSISFNLTIPVFNGLQTNSAIKKAEIAFKNAEYSLQTAKNTLYKSIQQAYADATASWNKYKSTQKSVEAMNESFKYTAQKFDVGMINTTEYNDSKNKLTEAESNLLQAKYEYIFRLKILDFYMGKPIELK